VRSFALRQICHSGNLGDMKSVIHSAKVGARCCRQVACRACPKAGWKG
jgi:hypothetical protein